MYNERGWGPDASASRQVTRGPADLSLHKQSSLKKHNVFLRLDWYIHLHVDLLNCGGVVAEVSASHLAAAGVGVLNWNHQSLRIDRRGRSGRVEELLLLRLRRRWRGPLPLRRHLQLLIRRHVHNGRR